MAARRKRMTRRLRATRSQTKRLRYHPRCKRACASWTSSSQSIQASECGLERNVTLIPSVELLRSYRIAHARIGAIETFEASLREYTPLTSISDTAAFIEYLGQLNVKSDMLMEELKRVSRERDDINKKLEDAEKRARESSEEVEALKAKTSSAAEGAEDDTATLTDSTAPSLASKTTKETDDAKDDEDFFSYDSELPRLQSQLQESVDKVGKLEEENKSLKGELSVAQESAESFMKNLETTSNDLNSFRDTHQRLQKDAHEREQELNGSIADLKARLETAENDLTKHKDDHTQDQKTISELQDKLESATKELQELHAANGEELVNQDQLQELRGQVESVGADLTQLREAHAKAEKRGDTLNGLLNNVRSQLKETEAKRDDALASLEKAKKDFEAKAKQETKPAPSLQPPPTPTLPAQSASAKRKNKKKNKGGNAPPSAPPSEVGDASGLLSPRDAEFSPSQLEDAQQTVAELKSELEEKVMAIERRHSML
jgi:chromosome segregation ATPase